MIFEDQTEAAVKLSLSKADLTGGGRDSHDARRAIEYYRDTAYQEHDLYQKMLPLYANAKKWEARPKAVYNLTAGIVDALCTLYQDPVIYDFGADKKAADLWDMVYGHQALMNDIDRYTFLGGTTAVRPVIISGVPSSYLYLADQIEYVQQPEDMLIAQQITVRWNMGQAGSIVQMAHHWTDSQVAETANDTLTGAIDDNPYKVIPISIFRNEEPRWEFFGEPARDLTAANLALNSLMTDLNHTVRWQSHGQLVLIGAPPNYQPPIGADTFLNVSNAGGGAGADAKYINPGADIKSIIEAINQNLEMLFSARRIPKSAVVAVQGDSGVSLVAQQASLRDYRKNRIATFRPQEERLIALTLTVINYHLTGKIEEFDPPTITYTELESPMSDEDRLEWDWKLRLGVASPEDVMMSLNPGMSEEDAAKKIEENLDKRNQRFMGEIADRRSQYVQARDGRMIVDRDRDGKVG